MGEIQRIEEQARRAFEGGAWHGPAVLELLAGVTAAQAAARPLAAAHSIWEVTLHIATWKSIVARRVKGEVVKDVATEVDWPPVTAIGEAEWLETLNRLRTAHQDLRATLRSLDEAQLDERPYPEASPRHVQLHGAIQHDLYHAGQIALLKKA
jgi:uncharacterized damage-inducible protein DinB